MSIWTPPKFGNVPFGPELTRGLVGYWPLDDQGGIAYDRSGYGNHGPLVGDTHSVVSGRGRVMSFDGTGDAIIKSNPSFINDQQGSITIWFSLGSLVTGLIVASVSKDGATDDEFYIYFRGDLNNHIQITNLINGAVSWAANTSINMITDTNWHFIVLASNSSIVKIYVDGQEKTLTDATGTNSGQWFADATDADIFTIGGLSRASLVVPFNGSIADVMIFNRSLLAQEVQQLYLYGLHIHRDPIELWTAANLAAFAHTVTINDGIGTTDSFGKAIAKALSDNLGITDSITKVSVYLRSIDDAVGLTDVTLKAIAKSFADDLGITDELSRGFNRLITDDLGITDDMLRAWAAQKIIADDIGITDSTAKGITKPLADDLGITDDMLRAWEILRVISDTLGLTDLISTDEINHYITNIADSISITDDVNIVMAFIRSVSDSIGISDSLSRGFGRSVTETIGVTDIQTKDIQKSIAEDLALTDAISRIFAKLLTINDDIGMSDSVSVISGLIKAAVAFLMLKKHR